MQHSTSYEAEQFSDSQLIHAIFRDTSIGIIVIREDGTILLANPFVLQLYGFTEKELTGNKMELLTPLRLRKKYIQYLRRYLLNPESSISKERKINLTGIRKNGSEFPIEVCMSHYRYKGELFLIIYVSDITSKHEEEKKIKQSNETLEKKVEARTYELLNTLKMLEASRQELQHSLEKEKSLNELKSRFVTMASHEFRTPLSTILSSTYLLEKYCNTEVQPQRKKHIDRIISSVNMLTDILNEFLSVGNIEEGKIFTRKSYFDIYLHVDNILNEMKSLQKKGQQISYTHTGEKKVFSDPGILKHIIMNLISNAIKFSPEEGLICIHTDINDNRLLLSIKDQGLGISKEDMHHLFERFYRGANVTNIQGTGLGLFIVSKYSELLNGEILCSSDLGKGTEFIIQFELHDEKKSAADNYY
ncbi:MAG: PAS domain S-box protein [Bacteroidetes bacterium]|nr:PAS domain S-box protein [Bacteroidota bacterium]MBS1929551.1 PAS domain S-box protein [Bacteroidota bacterium]